MEVIPAIDIIAGKCVRLTRGDYNQVKEYSSDPVQVAREFEDGGITRLHVVDLDGAKARQVVNLDTLSAIAAHTELTIDFGGGVKSRQDLEQVLQAGAAQVTAGSIAASQPEVVKGWIEEFGAEKIILGADVLDEQVMVSGWQKGSGIRLFEYLDMYIAHGISYVICTDIDKDGALQGPSLELYKRILKSYPDLKLIASGGVSSVQDLDELQQAGLYGTIVGKAFYEGRISMQQLSAYA